MPDQTIDCVDCSAPFQFTEAEQQFYAEKQLSTPKRCASCRTARRRDRDGGKKPLQLHAATCSKCNAACEVPFEPKIGKPVYCRPCFAQVQQTTPAR